MRCPTLIVASTGLLLLATPPRVMQAQTFEGEVGLKTPTGPIDALVKGERARFNTQTQMGPAAIIINPTGKEIYIVVDAQKMYLVMKMDDAVRAAADTSTGTLTALNKTETIAGYPCSVFRYRSATSGEDICIASSVGNLGVMAIFNGLGGGMGRGRPGSTRAPGWAGAVAQQGGFPLRVADTTGTVKYEITRIEAKPVDAALLSPPADYQRMEMPSFGRPPANQ
jgi:hypothetical protein